MACNDTILNGIALDCDQLSASVGVSKDLILVDYKYFDREGTLDSTNWVSLVEDDDQYSELTSIKLLNGATLHTFEGTDYSVVPTVTSEVKDDGDSWFMHSIEFVIYNKSSRTRRVLESLGRTRFIAIAVDKSTGKYELFGAGQGLKVSELERVYVGEQNSNFYNVTIATPDVAVVREGYPAYLSGAPVIAGV